MPPPRRDGNLVPALRRSLGRVAQSARLILFMDPIFESILRGAVEARASDIHIKPDAPVVFRVNRELITVNVPLPEEAWIRGILDELVPADLRERFAREREVDFAFGYADIGRFRVNAFQQRGQLTLALRVVKTQIPAFRDLNLPEIIPRIAEAPRGIVIIAGAIGSGKSTTLAAMIEHINGLGRKHIVTLEDPIEYLFHDRQAVIEQREIGIDTASFKSGLRHVLRQDPDVIAIGEMRDADSAAAAMSAANIGHLVLTTLHTADATKSVQRVLEFFPPEQRAYARRLFAATLHAVICQRLVLGVKGTALPALELLLNTAAVAKLIDADRMEKIAQTMEISGGDGMQTFDQGLRQLVTQGRISQEEALAHAANPESLRMAFQGVILSETRGIIGS
jgi:twitching motility protein PilT